MANNSQKRIGILQLCLAATIVAWYLIWFALFVNNSSFLWGGLSHESSAPFFFMFMLACMPVCAVFTIVHLMSGFKSLFSNSNGNRGVKVILFTLKYVYTFITMFFIIGCALLLTFNSSGSGLATFLTTFLPAFILSLCIFVFEILNLRKTKVSF